MWSQSSEGKLEWANEPFQKLFGNIGKKDNVFYTDIIRALYLLSIIMIAEVAKILMKEIVMDNHNYLLSASHNDQAKRIFILQNIDEIKQAEQMKKDFIVDLAHELANSFNCYHALAEAMDNETNTRYLKIIQNHTQAPNSSN